MITYSFASCSNGKRVCLVSERYRDQIPLRARFLCPPSKKEGHIELNMSVGMSVCRWVGMSVALNLVQLITQERFAQETSNLVGR